MYLITVGSDCRSVENQLWPYLPMTIPAVEQGWQTMLAGLDRLNRDVIARGGKLIVAMIEPTPVPYGSFALDRAVRASYPGGKALSFDLSRPRVRLAKYTACHGSPLIDLPAALPP